MKLSTLFRLLTRGFGGSDARSLEEEAQRIEAEESKKLQPKEQALTGFQRVNHFEGAFNLARWRRELGRGVDVGEVDEVEVWQKGEHFRLAVRRQDTWEVHVILPESTTYRLRRRLV